MKLRVANVVHGRFHAFDLVRELVGAGNECTLFTNYPAFAVERFGISRRIVRSHVSHGLLVRALNRLHDTIGTPELEKYTLPAFSKWAARKVARNARVQVIHCFTGIAEELFSAPCARGKLKMLVRGSSHIVKQRDLLLEEEARAGAVVDKPTPWIVERELREYALADRIIVLSSFARDSFVERGIAPEKLVLLPLGAQLSTFRPAQDVLEARARRIRSGARLRVLMTGTFSYRKGIIDFVEIARRLGDSVEFRFVGTVTDEGAALRGTLEGKVDFVPKQPQHSLAAHYNWADLFVFTTIEDGFAVVLSQAQAAGLPILATRNCGAPDIVAEGETGWVMPIRSPDAFVDRLEWCHAHRDELAFIAAQCHTRFVPRDWKDVAREFEEVCAEALGAGAANA